MILNMHASGLELTATMKEYIDRRIGFALDRFGEAIDSVTVTLEDTNGPRGGVDQRCQIRVKLIGDRNLVVAENTHEALRAAIDIAADCIGRSVTRTLDRKRTRRRATGDLELV